VEAPKSLESTDGFNPLAGDHQVDNADSAVLVKKLEEEQRSRIYLEGQLEAVREECEAALKERPKLVSSLSRAEAELAEMAAALEKERMRHKPPPDISSEDVSASRKAAENLRCVEQALAQEKRTLNDVKNRLSEEEQKSCRLEKSLGDAVQSLKDQELEAAKLRDKLQQKHMETGKKAAEVEEMVCRLSSLGASYDALEQNKSWLHDQLQEAQRAKVKLQEELRESKASGIAHEIKCDQLEKENVAHQEQIANLLQGVLQDKAKMVSQLETIQEDVLSHEDLYAKLIAERSQLEDAVRRKDEALAELGSDVAKNRVEKEELDHKLVEIQSANEQLVARIDEVERDSKRLSHKLGVSLRDVEEKDSDLKEVGKIKAALQDRLRNTDAELAGKDGTIRGLQEAKDLLQQEVALISDAKRALERESEESKREVALLEANLKSALERCREGDSRVREVVESQHSVEDQKQALHALLAEKDREIEQKDQAIKSMESQMGELLSDFGSLQDNFRSIASESGSVTNSITEKDRVISHLSSAKDAQDEQLRSLGKESEDLHQKVTQLQHENAHLLGQVEGSVDHDDFKMALQQKAQLQEELDSLKVDQKRNEIKTRAKISQLEADLKAAQKAASKAQEEIEGFSKKLSQSGDAMRNMEADLRVSKEKLQTALGDKEKAESVLSSLKPSDQKTHEVLKAKCGRLEEQNADLAEQLEQLAQQKAEVERASGLVAAKLKQNADTEKKKLLEKNRDVSLELERLKGRLAGMQATQVTVRDHAAGLETALAKKESTIVKLSAEVQETLEEKSEDSATLKSQISTLEGKLRELNADVAFQREQATFEKHRVEELEAEIQELKSSKKADESIVGDHEVEVSHLGDQLATISSEKEALQTDVSYLKSQLLIAKTSAESAKRQIADKASQVEILEQELRISERRCEQAEEEVRQLQDHLRTHKERRQAEGRKRRVSKAEGDSSDTGTQAEESTDQPEQPGSQSGLGMYVHRAELLMC
jgi:chromosome segregation ATPase